MDKIPAVKRILITRPRRQAHSLAAALRRQGYEPIFFPVIEIQPIEENQPLDRALQSLPVYDWIVFTSVNAVEQVWRRLAALGIARLPDSLRVAAIGPETARALAKRGAPPAFVPGAYIAEAILPGLGDLQDRWVLLPRAELARRTLPQLILQAGGTAHEIAVYRTQPAPPDPVGLAALRNGVAVITLTSPSTVENFCLLARQAGLEPLHLPGDPTYACIGPITAQAAQQAGLQKLVVAEEFTAAGLVRAIQKLESDNE